jgi:hypothetical protein
MKGVNYLMRASLLIVRKALVEIRIRFLRPCSSTNVTFTRLGCHLRLVRRCECDTLFPDWARFPVSGHTLAIAISDLLNFYQNPHVLEAVPPHGSTAAV